MANKSATILSDKEREHFQGYEYPFENLVLEGGGAKLAGAIGTVLVSILQTKSLLTQFVIGTSFSAEGKLRAKVSYRALISTPSIYSV